MANSAIQSMLLYNNTPLGIGENYTSDWVDITEHESIIFAAKADADGTMYVQFSPDATEGAGDSVPSQLTYNVIADNNAVHRLLRTRRYFRIRYVNGTSVQTSFHVQVFTGAGGLLTSVGRSSISQDADTLVTRSIPVGVEISRGAFAGYTQVEKFGRNSDIDIGTPEDVWEGGGDYTGHPSTSGETVQVFSANAADTSAGTGARTVMISGLDDNNALASETITLNGTTAVVSSNTYNRVFRGAVQTAGSGGKNAGIITCRHSTTTANVFFGIKAGNNQTSIAAYSVPLGKTLYITRINMQMARAQGNAGSSNVTLRVRESGGVYRVIKDVELSNSLGYLADLSTGAVSVPALSDIKFRVESASDNNTIVSAEFSGVLIDD